MSKAHRSHVIVGISGGVDSSVAALLLQQQGYRVSGLFMKNWDEDDKDGQCHAQEDHETASEVCARLGIPLNTVNLSSEYWEQVFRRFLAEYAAGRTPNPDVLCNREIKFKAFLDHALGLGADFIATGHYARIKHVDHRYWLLKGRDLDKDQSYFLHTVSQRALSKTFFPLGDHTKSAVRKLAHEAGLINYARKDSTGICFIGERPFKAFLSRYLPAEPGEIRTFGGIYKGRHDGLMYYTIGQRHGLGIGGPGDPWYVAAKDTERNILYVVQGYGHPALYDSGLVAEQLHWVDGHAPESPLSCAAKVRFRQTDEQCQVDLLRDGKARVIFDRPQRAIAPGQSVVLYRGTYCLGGGVIRHALGQHLPASDPRIAFERR